MKQYSHASNNNKKRETGGLILLAILLLALAVSACSTPEGGSSIPWGEPEPWEQQPNFGVPY